MVTYLSSEQASDTAGSALSIPITTAVPACDVTTFRSVIVWHWVYKLTGAPGVLTVTDDAVLTSPNRCYGLNPYAPQGSGLFTPGFTEIGWHTAPLYQPLPVGKSISIAAANGYDYAFGVAAFLENAHPDPVHTSADDLWTLGPRIGNCFTPRDDTVNAPFCDFGVEVLWESGTPGVSSLTYMEPAFTERNSLYDDGPQNLSAVIATAPLTPGGTYDIGGCTDVLPAFPNLIGGWLRQMGSIDAGLDPCPPTGNCQPCSHSGGSHSGGVHGPGTHCP